MAAKMGEEDLL